MAHARDNRLLVLGVVAREHRERLRPLDLRLHLRPLDESEQRANAACLRDEILLLSAPFAARQSSKGACRVRLHVNVHNAEERDELACPAELGDLVAVRRRVLSEPLQAQSRRLLRLAAIKEGDQ